MIQTSESYYDLADWKPSRSANFQNPCSERTLIPHMVGIFGDQVQNYQLVKTLINVDIDDSVSKIRFVQYFENMRTYSFINTYY